MNTISMNLDIPRDLVVALNVPQAEIADRYGNLSRSLFFEKAGFLQEKDQNCLEFPNSLLSNSLPGTE